jgi:DNA invertase Pin-like site-specific DNA recombinase
MADQLSQAALAYSYVRFSTARQELGDSLRRQVEMARRYAEEHGLRLAERSFRDLGVSGYRGKNVEVGALGAFLSAVRSGAVRPGSYLLIEQFDRLSRDQVHRAFRVFGDIVDAGITIVTMVDGKEWNSETIQDLANVMTSVILMCRAHDESKTKSDRVKEAWVEKKKAAATSLQVITSECPRWLKPNADKTGFDVIEERAESIRKVFEARIAGRGVVSIVRQANEEGWPAPGKQQTWHTSLVGRVLRNRALLGEYRPHENQADGSRKPTGDVIAGYYPAVIDEGTFLRAAAVSDRRGRFPGRRDASCKNWLQGLLQCQCGASMVRKNKNSLAQPGYSRYYCADRSRGLTKCEGVNAGQLEDAVIYAMSVVAPSVFDGSERLAEIRVEIDVETGKFLLAQQDEDNFTEAIRMGVKSPAVFAGIDEASSRKQAATAALKVLRAEAQEYTGDVDGIFKNIAARVAGLSSLDARSRLREDLARVIERVVVYEPQGYVAVRLRGKSTVPIHQPLRDGAKLPPVAKLYSTSELRRWKELVKNAEQEQAASEESSADEATGP